MKDYLTMQNLDFHYGDQQVLHNIDLQFPQKNITALIGASGSGKSTLLRCFNRIFELYPNQHISGQILLEGKDLLDKRLDVNSLRRRIGMVFQKPTPFPMSIYDNIAFAVRLHERLPKADLEARVIESLKKAALWDEVKDKLRDAGTHLSGGQQQRLCVARTIAIQPDILLLDEPTSALDPISSAKIEALIKSLQEEFTIIMVTHNLKQAQRISSNLVFLDHGRVVEAGMTQNLFSNPKNPLLKDYITNH
jgi:phosphate transport system ATP-binding protein